MGVGLTTQSKLDALHVDTLLQHTDCGVCDFCAPKKVTAKGNTEATIMIVGEAPGAIESEHGIPFVGPAGKLLDHLLDTVGLTAEDVWVTNSLMCRPPANRQPTVEEIAACNGRLRHEISTIKPKVIVPMGNTAVRAVLGDEEGITKIQGWATWREDYQAFVIPTFHPASLLYKGGDQNYLDVVSTLRRAIRMREFKPGKMPVPTTDWITASTSAQALEILDVMRDKSISVCALDIETTGLEWWENDIICMQFCWEPGRVAIFWHTAFDDIAVSKSLCAFMNSEAVEWVMWNGKFDKKFVDKFFRSRGLKSNVVIGFDGMLAHHLLDERRGVHSLKQNARDYLDAGSYADELEQYLPSKKTSFSEVPKPVLEKYAARDADYTLRLRAPLLIEMRQDAVLDVFHDHTMPAVNLLCEVEERGILFDHSAADKLQARFKIEVDNLLAEIREQAQKLGFDPMKVTGPKGALLKSSNPADLFNPNSSYHVCSLIYDVLAIPIYDADTATAASTAVSMSFKRGTRRTSSYSALDSMKDKSPIIKDLIEYRRIIKMVSTFIEGPQKLAHRDGRIRTEFSLHGTRTGRLASSQPNLQNLPRGDFDDGLIRKLFIASEGNVFLIADYAQLELRIAANYSEDQVLCDSLGPGRDLHAETASSVFKKPIEDLTSNDRYWIKKITFGILFGRSAYSLAKGDLGCTVEEAEQYVSAFYERYADLKKWIDETVSQAQNNGVVVSTFGRKRRFPFWTDSNRNHSKNQAINAPIQSLASDITLHAVGSVQNWLRKQHYGHCVLTVHDSGVFEVPEDAAADAARGIQTIMEDPPIKRVLEFPVDVKIGADLSIA